MARVDRSDVAAILRGSDRTQMTDASEIDPCIVVANLLVTAELPDADDTVAASVEAYWAAYIWKRGIDGTGGHLASRRSFDVVETYRELQGGKADLSLNYYGQVLQSLLQQHGGGGGKFGVTWLERA